MFFTSHIPILCHHLWLVSIVCGFIEASEGLSVMITLSLWSIQFLPRFADPVKAARPGGPTSGPRGPLVGHNGPGQQHPVPHADQLRRLEAEVAARAAELKAARAERDQFGRGVEALTILIHHLTNTVSIASYTA